MVMRASVSPKVSVLMVGRWPSISCSRKLRRSWAEIEAIIDASFTERQFQPQVIVTWLAFWGQAPHDETLMRLQRVYARRLQSNLRHELRLLVGDGRAAVVTQGLAAMIDGLWLDMLLNPKHTDRDAAKASVRVFLAGLFPKEFGGKVAANGNAAA